MRQDQATKRSAPDGGFSFIELLAYMAIAALLILAAIPQFNQYRQKATLSGLENDVHNAALDVEAITASDPLDTLTKSDVEAAVAKTHLSDPATKFVSHVDVDGNYTIQATNPQVGESAAWSSYEDTGDGWHPGVNIVPSDYAIPSGPTGGTIAATFAGISRGTVSDDQVRIILQVGSPSGDTFPLASMPNLPALSSYDDGSHTIDTGITSAALLLPGQTLGLSDATFSFTITHDGGEAYASAVKFNGVTNGGDALMMADITTWDGGWLVFKLNGSRQYVPISGH